MRRVNVVLSFGRRRMLSTDVIDFARNLQQIGTANTTVNINIDASPLNATEVEEVAVEEASAREEFGNEEVTTWSGLSETAEPLASPVSVMEKAVSAPEFGESLIKGMDPNVTSSLGSLSLDVVAGTVLDPADTDDDGEGLAWPYYMLIGLGVAIVLGVAVFTVAVSRSTRRRYKVASAPAADDPAARYTVDDDFNHVERPGVVRV